MTTPGAQATTLPFPLTPGAAPQAITDGGNSPVGMTLVNRGDNGGTVWVQAGPSGRAGAAPLGPGGTITWTDPTTLPYAYLASSATQTETLLITNQSAGYSNPTAVAAATAAKLLATGIPNLLVQDILYTQNDALVGGDSGPGGVSTPPAPLNVARYSSLLIHATWSSRSDGTGATGPAALRCQFPAGYVELYGHSGWAGGDSAVFIVPVTGPTVQITNRFAQLNAITVYGTNQPASVASHVIDPGGVRSFGPMGAMTAGTTYNLTSADSLGLMVRLGGRVQFSISCQSVGVLFVNYPGADGAVHTRFGRSTLLGDLQIYDLALPRLAPVLLQYRPDSASGYFSLSAAVT